MASGHQRSNATTIAISHGVASRILRGLYANLPMEQALTLEVTRDVIFKLADGRVGTIRA